MTIPETSRRDFMKKVGAGALALGALGSEAASKPQNKTRRPNLLIIHTDQQSAWTLSAYGGGPVQTPHLDSLAKEGVLLENFFTNSAVCSPSRACFLTGQYPSSHGVYKNDLPLKPEAVTLATVLRDAGYDTGYAGKWHLNGNPRPGWAKPGEGHGFEDCRYLFNRGHWKIIDEQPEGEPRLSYKEIGDEKTYTTDWLTQKTLAFLKKPGKKPFCFMLSIPDPHTPYTVRKPFDTMYAPEALALPSTVNQREGKAVRPPKQRKKFEANLRKWKSRYCGEVKCIDDNAGRILTCLEESGLVDHTIVVFTTDHGDYMGEHGLTGKNMLYETAYRIPFLIRWPKGLSGGRRLKEIISTVDFAPTLLSLMGIKPPPGMEGRDASKLLLGKKGLVPGKKEKWEEISHTFHSSQKCAGLFTPEFQFVIGPEDFRLKKAPCRMLYDRINDPDQTCNLFDDPKYRKQVRAFQRIVLEHHRKPKTPCLEWLEEV